MSRFAEIVDDNGGVRAVARALGVAHSAVVGWCQRGTVPGHAAWQIVQLYGCEIEEIAPDLCAAAVRAGLEPMRYAQIISDSGAIVNRYN